MPEPSSARYQLPYLSAGQAQKELTHNEALALIDAGLHASAAGIGLSAPPAAPEPGQCWVVGDAPTGAWTGQAGALAIRTSSGWRFLAAREGMRVWLEDQQLWAERRADAWVVGELRADAVMIGGRQVLGSQRPSIPEPTGGGTTDIEARVAIAALIARLVEHGLIAA